MNTDITTNYALHAAKFRAYIPRKKSNTLRQLDMCEPGNRIMRSLQPIDTGKLNHLVIMNRTRVFNVNELRPMNVLYQIKKNLNLYR